jgi:hypothetical protein
MPTRSTQDALANPVRIGLIGAGRIGAAHAETLARRVPGARLSAIADPRPGAAEAVANPLGARGVTDPAEIFSDPEIEAVVIAALRRLTPASFWQPLPQGRLSSARSQWQRRWKRPVAQSAPRGRPACLFRSASIVGLRALSVRRTMWSPPVESVPRS